MNTNEFPPINLLTSDEYCMTEVEFNKNRIAHILAKFGVRAEIIEHIAGPAVDLYEVYPAEGSKVHRLAAPKEDGASSDIEDNIDEVDLLAIEAARHISEGGIPKIDALQKRFSISYTKASKVMAKLRATGLMGLSKKINQLPK